LKSNKNNNLVRIFLTLVLDHQVIQEDTPIQRMMHKTLKVSPANLFPYNPLILMDYQSNNEFKKDREFKI
jgi:Cu2+-containing amine oxidase